MKILNTSESISLYNKLHPNSIFICNSWIWVSNVILQYIFQNPKHAKWHVCLWLVKKWCMYVFIGRLKATFYTSPASFEASQQSQENIGVNTLLQQHKSPSGIPPSTNHKELHPTYFIVPSAQFMHALSFTQCMLELALFYFIILIPFYKKKPFYFNYLF